MIKHISFDFWDTLYIGNPKFREARAKYLSDKYGRTSADIQGAVNRTKELCDGSAEATMYNISTLTQCWHLLDELGFPTIGGAFELEETIHNAFIYNPPIRTFDSNDLLDLRHRGYSLSISCNTGLISSDAIIEMLKQTGAYDLFDFVLFSDKIGHFKPSPFFMREVLMYSKSNLFSEILHIGDNPNTDGKMCHLTGAKYMQVQKGSTLNIEEINKYL